MTLRLLNPNFRRQRRKGKSAGFSLLEALIAVVVLSTGLLALAALQAALIRSSVDARIRSAASIAAVSVIENLRSGSYNSIPLSGVTSVDPLTAPFLVADPALGAGGFAVSYQSTGYFDNGGVFTTVQPVPPAPPPLAEFKKIDVSVSWQDPFNPDTTRSVALSDIIGPLGSSLTTPDLTQIGNNLEPQRPIVRTDSPAGPGVIPIAVGDNEETAATNPRPVIVSKGGDIVETRFDVLNFGSGGDSFPDTVVEIQKRVETSIAACQCRSGANAGPAGTIAGTPFRPTFWDGTRYVPPKRADGSASPENDTLAPPASGPSPAANVQSSLCTECCRDHHDPSGVGGATFDPFRVSKGIAHQHFSSFNFSAAGQLESAVPAGSGSDYFEACRLIRVDGLWRVAADLDSRFFGLLKTEELSLGGTLLKSAVSPVPAEDAVSNYQDFVLDVLGEEFVNESPAENPNDPDLDQTSLEARYTGFDLDKPDQIAINRPLPVDRRFLHARGFYIDYLEKPAKEAIDRARANCDQTASSLASCVLPFVPFTTINTTELSSWSVSDEDALTVLARADGGLFGDITRPTAGAVNAGTGGSSLASALVANRRSNSGLVASGVLVDPQDLEEQGDIQYFSLSAGGTGTGDSFSVKLDELPQTDNPDRNDDPLVGWEISGDGNFCSPTYDPPKGGSNQKVDNDPNNYVCKTFAALSNDRVSVRLGGYNRKISFTENNPCSGGTGEVSRPYCQNFRVSTPTGASVVPADNTADEVSVVTFTGVNANATLLVSFEKQFSGNGEAAAPVCSATGTVIGWEECFDPVP